MNDDNSSRRKGERTPGTQNFIWYALLAIVAVLLVVGVMLNANRRPLAYPDFERLVEHSKRDKNHQFVPWSEAETQLAPEGEKVRDGSILVTSDPTGDGKPGKVTRFSNLRDVRVDDRQIRGKVDLETLNPPGPPEDVKKGVDFVTYTNNSDKRASELTAKLGEYNIDWKFVEGPTVLWTYAPALIMTLLFVVLFLLMMRRLSGVGSPMQFGRSRGKLFAQEDLGVMFDDVAGIDEAVEEVREVVDFLRSPEKYHRLGGRIPKGVLLVGPPGTGKTLLAKAIAGEAGTPFFSLSGSDFVEMFVGVGAARVRDMFQQAEAKAPCIIFIDELDALGKTRGGSLVGGHDEREQTLNALLVEMDGFAPNTGVIVMAASNRPETLDPALMRPGRFDRHVMVDRPDVRGREEILKVHVKSVKLDPTVDLKGVAAITPGFVGADLANLVNEACLLAARNEKNSVGMKEFNEGVERVTAGLEKKQRIMNGDEKNRVAYHESGHALVAYSLPNTDPVHKVSIIPRGMAALGYTMQRPDEDRYLMTQCELESRIQVLLAGTVAEEIIYTDISTGAQNDLERATNIARAMVMDFGMSRMGRVNYRESNRSPFLANGQSEERTRGYSENTSRQIDQEVKRIIDEGIESVRHILDARRAALEALTQRLIEVESIDADELKEIIEENSTGPLVVPGTMENRPRNHYSRHQQPEQDEPPQEAGGAS
ncbi:ATP-dependent zinc metalloprotease FtsH [Lignipirellula cremea]|uniref:ATP-dependent zinc metalloprotease FtsH n=1 Tax=Lignipirellula cremea TaxID=2528010 RepID=A0A518DR89_9BACT|nr:ATP-dependent zinc metalloprotease FtsH [Lignipirellula cremea]QDU94356.1 ATP-dependent zinc metalloprotease FtsH 4 [Lignipirellula cremea]